MNPHSSGWMGSGPPALCFDPENTPSPPHLLLPSPPSPGPSSTSAGSCRLTCRFLQTVLVGSEMEGESSFRLGVWGSGGRSWAGQLHAGSVFLFLSEGFRGLFMWQRGSCRDSEGTVEEGWSCSGVSAVSILVCWVQCLCWKRSESGLHLSLLESDIIKSALV